MRLATFGYMGLKPRVGLVQDDEIIDVTRADPSLPIDLIDFVLGEDLLKRTESAAKGGPRIPLVEVTLFAPILRPPEFIGVGLNYKDHAREANLVLPPIPTVFNKQITCINGPNGDVLLPKLSNQLDFEGELAFIVGRAARGMSVSAARRAIFGYIIVNDFSLRDIQMSSPTHTMGKSFDTHGPCGPWVVTADEIYDPQRLSITTHVNGQIRQKSSTSEMIFSCAEILSHLSSVMTIAPGTIITTGTPAGVGFGKTPPVYLKEGDIVEVSIEAIGKLANRIVQEADAPL